MYFVSFCFICVLCLFHKFAPFEIIVMMKSMNGQMRTMKIEYEGKSYELSVRLRPAAELIVLLHGWGGSKEGFGEAFSFDALQNFGICTIDLLGFGKSEKPTDFGYDLQDQANIVALVINSFGAKKVYLVGHSMGGGIGTLAAPSVNNLAMFINAESNLATKGSGADIRSVAKRPFWLFRSSTLSVLKSLLRRHPRRSMRVWARWFDEASPYALYRSAQSLMRWSDSGELLPSFISLPSKAYIYSAKGKRRKDVVPKLDAAITYEVVASGHSLITDNPEGFYVAVANIIQDHKT